MDGTEIKYIVIIAMVLAGMGVLWMALKEHKKNRPLSKDDTLDDGGDTRNP